MSTNHIFKTTLLGILVTGFSIGCNAKAENKAGDNLAANTPEKTAVVINNNEAKPTAAASNTYSITKVGTAGGNKMTDFSWMQNGKTVSLAEVAKGKVVFLNFWATWCPPCRKEIPDIIELSKELPASDFVVVGVSLDSDKDGTTAVSLVDKFAASKGIPYLNVVGNEKLTAAYGGISSIPTTFIIDKSGNIVERITGSQTKQEFLAMISKCLNK
ncbi:MAG: TlpA disulfide reductase family protein [Bacteroidota bacterium]